ncbi:hypothetical protein [Rhodoferax ferrireducens]|uniref:hypothetical protein n=1 Tax=Rhodoferax ferrireducens TaxID=192843 RepID=UPI0002D32C50|nr:hypothetical protein [Rhodoferax ferrireducens]
MAEVFQIVATDASDKNFEPDAVERGYWHAATTAEDAPQKICGIQVEGEGGYAPGPSKHGRVTCMGS